MARLRLGWAIFRTWLPIRHSLISGVSDNGLKTMTMLSFVWLRGTEGDDTEKS